MRYIRRKTKQWFIPSWKPTGTMTCANESYISMFKDTCQIKQEKTSKNNSSLVTKDHFSDTWSCTNNMTSLDNRVLMHVLDKDCCSGINQTTKNYFILKFVKKNCGGNGISEVIRHNGGCLVWKTATSLCMNILQKIYVCKLSCITSKDSN